MQSKALHMAQGHGQAILSLLRGASGGSLWVAFTGAESRARREMCSQCGWILFSAWHWVWSAWLALADGIRERNISVLLSVCTGKHKLPEDLQEMHLKDSHLH